MEPIPVPHVNSLLCNIKLLRKQRELSAQAVAEKLCISVRRYRAMESGLRSVSLDQFFHIATILAVPVNVLMEQLAPETTLQLNKAS